MAPLFSEIYPKWVRLLDLGLISVELLAAERGFPSSAVSGQLGVGLVQSHPQCALLLPAAEPAGLPWAGGSGNHHVPAAGIWAGEGSLCAAQLSLHREQGRADRALPTADPWRGAEPCWRAPCHMAGTVQGQLCISGVRSLSEERKYNSCPTFITIHCVTLLSQQTYL